LVLEEFPFSMKLRSCSAPDPVFDDVSGTSFTAFGFCHVGYADVVISVFERYCSQMEAG